MTVYDDVRIIRERLECAKPGATAEALKALDRLEATLPRPVYERGFYQYGDSSIYWTDGGGRWWDATNSYLMEHPSQKKLAKFVRLYRADEVSSLT